MKKYAVTNETQYSSYSREFTFGNNPDSHFASYEEAQTAKKKFCAENRRFLRSCRFGENSVVVEAVECNDDGTAKSPPSQRVPSYGNVV